METSAIVVGLGELLWDMLPSGPQLGGAPANFAYCAHLLGDRGIVVSRLGDDLPGRDAREELREHGVTDEFLQADAAHPTGTVSVELDGAGQPQFEIKSEAAWDFMEWNSALEHLAHSCNAVCIGTLAQRSEQSRSSILKFLSFTQAETLRVFDVNLRQSFYSAEVVKESLRRANAVKLNDQELPVIAALLGIDEARFCNTVLEMFDLRFICVTRGESGSVLYGREGIHEHRGFRVSVKDTVGAGDAFAAGLVHEYLRGSSLAEMNDTANRMGAWVASSAGGMPEAPVNGLASALANLFARR